MDYGEIIRTAFTLAWRHKSLWLLGLFASGSANFSFDSDFDFPGTGLGEFGGDGLGYRIGGFFESNPWLLVPLVGLILIYALTFLILNCICSPALVDAVNNLTRGGHYRLGKSFLVGVGYFWRFLGITIAGFLAAAAAVFVFVMIVVLMFVLNVFLGILSLLVVIPLGFFTVLFISNVFALAERALVIRDIDIGDALSEGYYLFMNNKVPNLIIFLLYIVLVIAISVGVMIILAILAVPFYFMATHTPFGLIGSLAVGIPVFLAVSLPVSGFLGASFEAMYTLFYFRLVEPAGGAVSPQTGSP